MNKKVIYATFDTETLGGASHPEGVYNLGGLIHDREGNIFASFNLIIAEHYNKILEKSYYGKSTFHRYQEMLESGNATMVATEQEAIELVANLLNLYNVKYIMAYNTDFDLRRTDCKILAENRQFIDIYQMATEIITPRPTYNKYCQANQFLTKNGNPQAKVETVYGYLTNNPQFVEEHTAFSDASQEMEIFLKCVKAHKSYTKNKHKNSDWAKWK